MRYLARHLKNWFTDFNELWWELGKWAKEQISWITSKNIFKDFLTSQDFLNMCDISSVTTAKLKRK